jgi:hypothetical protein
MKSDPKKTAEKLLATSPHFTALQIIRKLTDQGADEEFIRKVCASYQSLTAMGKERS